MVIFTGTLLVTTSKTGDFRMNDQQGIEVCTVVEGKQDLSIVKLGSGKADGDHPFRKGVSG